MIPKLFAWGFVLALSFAAYHAFSSFHNPLNLTPSSAVMSRLPSQTGCNKDCQ